MARKDSKKSKKRILSETKVNDISTESEKSIDESNGLLKSFTGNRKMVSVFLFVLSFLVFIPSLGNDFVWDDVTYIQNKADKLNLSSIKSELIPLGSTENKTGGNYYRPVYLATLILDNEIWNTSPLGFHLTNIILHSISTVLLYFLVLILLGEFKILGRESIALITSTLFALYPLHVESVSFVSARGDILAAIFFFLSLIFYIFSYKKLFYLLLSALCFFLSLLSKEVAIALPLVVISFDLISRRIMSRVNLVKYLVLSLMTLIYFLMRSKSHTSIVELINSGSAQISAGFLHLADVILNTYLFYFIKMVFPYNLNPFIDSVPDWGLLGLILSILLLLALCIAFFMSVRKKENLTAFSILWILATLIPAAVVAILPLALTNYAERFLYIPSAGICVLFAYIIYESGKRFKLELPSLVLTLVIAVSFAVVTLGAQKVWRNNLSLWERAVSTSPDSPGVKINYGDALRNSGNPSESLKNYLSAYENRAGLNTRARITIAHSIAVAYIDLGNYQNAERWLDVAINLDQKYVARYNYLKGFISLRRNDPAAAKKYLLKSVEQGPSARAYYLLGGISYYEAQNRNSSEKYRETERYLNQALNMNPSFSKASLLLAKVYLALGDKQKARENAENAVRNTKEQEVLNEAQSILQMN